MMTQVAGYLLLPALPEIFLACMAMLLLMIGAYLGVRVTKLILGLSIFMLVCTGAIICLLPSGKVETFGGSSFRERSSCSTRCAMSALATGSSGELN